MDPSEMELMAMKRGCPAEGEALAVAFAVVAQTAWQDEVRLVGSDSSLGAWKPEFGLRLSTCDLTVPVWTICLDSVTVKALRNLDSVEYKFVIVTAHGWSLWEPGVNRTLNLGPNIARGGWIVSRFGDQVALEPSRPPAKLDAGPARFVLWDVTCDCLQPGDDVVVVGSAICMGAWNPARGIVLRTSELAFPQWTGTSRLDLNAQAAPTWKLAIRRASGEFVWEHGNNRALTFRRAGPTMRICDARATFGDGQGQVPSSAASSSVDLPCDVHRDLYPEDHLPMTVGSTAQGMPRQYSSISTCSTGLTGDDDPALCSPRLADDSGDSSPVEGDSAGPWLWSGAHCVGKSGAGCEDAYFVNSQALGVADGVGSMTQFSRYGVDVAAYATELMEAASRALAPGGAAERDSAADAPDLRAQAAIAAAEVEATAYGAATMIVVELLGTSIGVANLGDSGFMVLRRGQSGYEVLARSSEQQHTWNFPYQLMRLPPSLRAKLVPGTRLDRATDCDRYHLPVRAGDLILVFTDGLSDNLHEHEILQVVDRVCARGGGAPGRPTADPEYLARELALAARARSVDCEVDSPFSLAAREHGQMHAGGKEDDITIAAAWVVAE